MLRLFASPDLSVCVLKRAEIAEYTALRPVSFIRRSFMTEI